MKKITGGPKLLLLGQDYLEDYSDEYFLKAELNQLYFEEEKEENQKIYDFLLDSSYKLKDNVSTWNEFFIKFELLSGQLSISNKLQLIGSVLWNGVVTTSTDGLLDNIFSDGNRNIVNVIDANQRVSNFSSSENLHITKLFGDMQHDDLRIPKNKIEESKFYHEAINILTKFYTPELLTQFGTLFIESYNPLTDWLNDEKIFPVLSKFGEKQILFFSFKDEFLKSEYIKELIDQGIILPYRESLSSYLETIKLNDSEVSDELFSSGYDEGISTIKISKKRVKIPKNIKSNQFKILDDYLNLKSIFEEEYVEDLYREFHYSSGKNPNWDHFKMKFNIEREFEEDVVDILLKSKKLEFDKKDIVLVKGQNSSGKSISFANIAFKLKSVYDEVVLYIPQILGSIDDFVAIDNFCEWAEQNNSKLVYIFCDCSFDESSIDKYLLLNNYLLERGRNIQIVGTIYNLNDDFLSSWIPNKTFECSISLTDVEKENLIENIKKYSVLERSIVDSIEDKNLLVSIYRLLPETRKNIRLGTVREGEYSKRRLKEGINQEVFSNNPFYLFFKNEDKEVITKSLENIDVSKLFELICFVGQYDLSIPIDLLFRTSNHKFTGEVFKILEQIDFFRINTLEDGGMSIVIRNHTIA